MHEVDVSAEVRTGQNCRAAKDDQTKLSKRERKALQKKEAKMAAKAAAKAARKRGGAAELEPLEARDENGADPATNGEIQNEEAPADIK